MRDVMRQMMPYYDFWRQITGQTIFWELVEKERVASLERKKRECHDSV